MDYRHYWKLNPNGNEQQYQLALMCITNLLDENYNYVANGRGDPNTEPHTRSFITFNGRAPHDHETFYLPAKLSESTGRDSCNTARKPYDRIVTACLAILQEFLGDDIQIFSDGTREDWNSGVSLAGEVWPDIKNVEFINEN
jgi:hypothetical protein